MPLPPRDEQTEITQSLDSQSKRIGDLIGKAEAANERLRDHRTALISAAVTGEIDAGEEVVE